MPIGGIASSIAILAGAGGKGGKRERQTIIDLWNKLETSNFDFTQLTYPERVMVKEMMPDVYQAIVPEGVELAQEDPQVRTAQLEAMGQMGEIARGGMPLADQIAVERVQNALSQERRGRDQAVLRSLAARGALGSGDEGQLRLASNAYGNNLARDLGQSAIETSLNRRMNAIGQYGGQAAQTRYGDFRASAFNAEAMNRFNEMVAGMQTDAARYAADSRTRAQAYNVGTAQRLADEETTGRLGLRVQQQGREDQLKQEQFDQMVRKTAGQTGAYAGMANYKDRDRAAKERAIAGIGSGVDNLITSIYGGGQGGAFAGIGGQKQAAGPQYVSSEELQRQLEEAYRGY